MCVQPPATASASEQTLRRYEQRAGWRRSACVSALWRMRVVRAPAAAVSRATTALHVQTGWWSTSSRLAGALYILYSTLL